MCVGVPLITVFTQHLTEVEEPAPATKQTISKEDYVNRLSAIDQDYHDKTLREVTDMPETEGPDQAPHFRVGSLPEKGLEDGSQDGELEMDLDIRKTAPMILEPLTPLRINPANKDSSN